MAASLSGSLDHLVPLKYGGAPAPAVSVNTVFKADVEEPQKSSDGAHPSRLVAGALLPRRQKSVVSYQSLGLSASNRALYNFTKQVPFVLCY